MTSACSITNYRVYHRQRIEFEAVNGVNVERNGFLPEQNFRMGFSLKECKHFGFNQRAS